MIARPQGDDSPPSGVYQGERIVRAHRPVEAHRDGFLLCAPLADAQVAVDHQPRRRAQFRDPLRNLVRVVRHGADRRGAGQHRRPVALLGPQAHDALAARRRLDERAHLLAFDHHGLVVGADASGLEPFAAEQSDQQRVELAEMRGTLDRAGAQAQALGGLVVVDRQMTVVGLRGQHLPRRSQRTAQRGRGEIGERGGVVGGGHRWLWLAETRIGHSGVKGPGA
jgi:hypothetical protein